MVTRNLYLVYYRVSVVLQALIGASLVRSKNPNSRRTALHLLILYNYFGSKWLSVDRRRRLSKLSPKSVTPEKKVCNMPVTQMPTANLSHKFFILGIVAENH